MSLDGKKYGMQLKESGVQVLMKSFPKLVHGFLYIPLYEEGQKVQWTKEIKESLCELDVL